MRYKKIKSYDEMGSTSSPSTYEASYYGARGSTWSRNAPESYITT
jgi:hypothetical protein